MSMNPIFFFKNVLINYQLKSLNFLKNTKFVINWNISEDHIKFWKPKFTFKKSSSIYYPKSTRCKKTINKRYMLRKVIWEEFGDFCVWSVFIENI